MKNLSILLLLVFVFSQKVNANDSLGGCLVQVPNIFSESNDWLASGCQKDLISSGNSQALVERYSKNLDLKFSVMVAKQLKGLLEDLGTTSDFYEQNDQSFPDTGRSCKLEFVKTLETSGCNGKGATPEEKEKFKMLSDALGGENFKAKSLMESVLNVYSANKYGEGFGEKMNQCPLNRSAFPLNSQITNESATEIIHEFSLSENDFNIGKTYEKYPTLSMVKDSGMQSEFESYIKVFKGKKEDAKNYVTNFFFNLTNKTRLAQGVANKCGQVQSSLASFICHPLSNKLPNDSKISKKLFEGYDTAKSLEEQSKKVQGQALSRDIAGYKCVLEGSKKGVNVEVAPASAASLLSNDPEFCLNLTEKTSTVDSYYRCFNEGVRAEGKIDNSLIQNFCSMYTCQNSIVKNTASCKGGGPLSAKDLENLNIKDDTISNQITYMKILEKHAKDRDKILASLNSADQNGKNAGAEVIKGMSAFDIDLFGLEGALKILNIPTPAIAIALTDPLIADKIAKPITPEEIKQIVNREFSTNENTQVAEAEANFAPPISNNYYPTSNRAPITKAIEGIPVKKKKEIANDNDFLADDLPVQAKSKKDEDKLVKKDRPVPQSDLVVNNNFNNNDDAIDRLKSEFQNTQNRFERKLNDLSNQLDEQRRKLDDLRAKNDALERRIRDLNATGRPENIVQAKNMERELETNNLNLKKADADLKKVDGIITLTPKDLKEMDENDLKKQGIDVNSRDYFIIAVKVRLPGNKKEKYINVRVSKFTSKSGKTFLLPKLETTNEEVSDAIKQSPLFKDYLASIHIKRQEYSEKFISIIKGKQ